MKKNIFFITFFSFLLMYSISYFEPIKPIPKKIKYNKELALLGMRLYHDPRLSKDGTVSCASCHDLKLGGTDNKKVSSGVYKQKGLMNAPTVLNAVFNFRQFWNGRAKSLVDQASMPIHNPVEMAMDEEKIINVLKSDKNYKADFLKLFNNEEILFLDAMKAIAEFERALTTPNCKLDRYLRGELQLTELEKEGYVLFKRLGCVSCHNGVNVGGNSFQYIGVINSFDYDGEVHDLKHITQENFDKFRFKVPTLRNVELTAPYFHDGSVPTLKEAVKRMAFHNLGLSLSDEEQEKILAFLKTLTGERPAILNE